MIDKDPEKELETLTEEFESLSEYIQDLWQFLPLPIFNVNPEGVILDTNEAFAALSGYSVADAIGRQLKDFLPTETSKQIIGQALTQKTQAGLETFLLTKRQEKIEVAIYTSVRKDKAQNVLGFFMALIDIRANKKFQEELEKRVQEKTKELLNKTKALEQSEKALMNILEDIEEARRKIEEEKNKTLAIITNFMDGLLFFDKENKLVLMNTQAETLLNLKKDKMLGKAIAELAGWENIDQIISVFNNNSEKILRNEIEIAKDVALEVSVVPVAVEKEILGSLIIIHDITREKLVEKMKTEFVSLTAHQLRTPLSAIKWSLKMVLEGDLGSLNEEQRKFLEKTYASNERMIRLINDLLNVTRIEEGKFIYKPAPLQLEEIVQNVIAASQDKINFKAIELKYLKPAKKLPLIKMDMEKMQIAISNLLDNAVDYTPKKGKIAIELSIENNKVKFSIADTGVGIPKGQQHRIFSKFFRGENVVKMETDGTGLGTFITKNIIDAHGGEIWFDSKEGKGTTFYFTLPIS